MFEAENKTTEEQFAEIQNSISALINERSALEKRPILLKIEVMEYSLVFSLITIQDRGVATYNMYDFLIQSSRAGMNVVQRLQLSGSLKIKQIRDMYSEAAKNFEENLIRGLSEKKILEGDQFLLFGISMGELKVFVFAPGSGVGEQVREVSRNEIYDLFNFQKGSGEGIHEEEE